TIVLVGGGAAVATGGRPALPRERAGARVPAVGPHPVGRAGRQREQHRQPGREPVGDGDGHVAVGHVDMDLSATDELLANEELVVVVHLPVAGGVGGGERGRAG